MNLMLAVEVESIRKRPTDEVYRAVLYVLCDRNFMPLPGIVITGVGGDIKSEGDRTPFVILKDGRGDYGSDYEDISERFFTTNLRSKKIRVGEIFTTWSSDPDRAHLSSETTFRIKKVTSIAGRLAA